MRIAVQLYDEFRKAVMKRLHGSSPYASSGTQQLERLTRQLNELKNLDPYPSIKLNVHYHLSTKIRLGINIVCNYIIFSMRNVSSPAPFLNRLREVWNNAKSLVGQKADYVDSNIQQRVETLVGHISNFEHTSDQYSLNKTIRISTSKTILEFFLRVNKLLGTM